LFCIADVKGTFTEVNPAWTKLFGWTAEELTTHPWTYFVHPDDLLETIEVSKIPAGTLLDGFVNRYRTKDGDYIKNPLVCISLD
jgi:PAS domain S-box-containing protein